MKNYTQFGMLCEAVIKEASGTLNILGQEGGPAAKKLVQKLHTDLRLPHDFDDYKKVDRVDWSTIKGLSGGWRGDASKTTWILFIGTYGSGAVVPTTSRYSTKDVQYRAITCDNSGNINTQTFSRSGDAMRMIKEVTNKIKSIYVGRGKPVPEKQRYVDPIEAGVSIQDLIKRFKPAFAKIMTQAIADIKGMVITQIKNDAYEKVTKKIARLEALHDAQERILDNNYDSSEDEFFKKVLRNAIATTAAQYYPDDTGTITHGYQGLNVQNDKGMRQVAKDIARGDSKKLATIYYYLKREFVAS